LAKYFLVFSDFWCLFLSSW